MMYVWGSHMSGWGWLLILGLVAAGTMVVVRLVQAILERPLSEQAPTPQELLAGRFARGEIDEAEYRHNVDVLAESPENRPTNTP